MNKTEINIKRSGDSAVFVRMSDIIHPSVSEEVIGLHRLLSDHKPSWYIESVPSYTGLMIYYKPLKSSFEDIEENIHNLYSQLLSEKVSQPTRLLEIPVCYENEYAPDLDIVADKAGMDKKQVIELHSSARYQVYMIGFTPGFPYMGGLDQRLSTPRKKDPRLKIKAGSVGIAGNQTGIYPLESPGGWQIIGRTPLSLYRPAAPDPFLFRVGDRVVFKPISLSDFFSIAEDVRTGTYNPSIADKDERN